jgi:hypothetical protein
LSVPLKEVYERKEFPPSVFSKDHKRFYTIQRLFYEIELSIPRPVYKVIFCEEHFNDSSDFNLPLYEHAHGPYEIEIILEKL